MARLFFPIILLQGKYRPIIPIKFINPQTGLEFTTLACIDSGADSCVFPKAIAGILGHNLEKGDKIDPHGYGGKTVSAYLHTNNIELTDIRRTTISWRCPSYFTEGVTRYGLLGLNGFFSA